MGSTKLEKKMKRNKRCHTRVSIKKDEARVGPSPSETDDKRMTAGKGAEDVTGAYLKSRLSKKACKKEMSEALTSNELNKTVNQGDSNEPDSVGILRGRKDKSRKAHGKRKDKLVPNDNGKSSQEVEEATTEDVYQISSGEGDCSQGMKKWIKEYHERRPGLKVLQQKIDDFITAHEEQEEQASKEREAKMAEEGWTVVVHHKGGKKTTDPESGVAVGSVAEAAVRDKLTTKKSKDVGLDFYRFQKKEAQRSEIMKLQSKFAEDKNRIQRLRAARKFRPY